MSASPKTTRVTTGGSASEICARAISSAIRPSIGELRVECVMRHCSQRMTAPVFVDEVFRRPLAQRAKPLRAIGAHPDEVAGLDRIPRVAEAVDAAAFEHQQAVLHHVNLHHAERRAGIVGHGVHGKVVRRAVGHERAHAQRIVAHERDGLSRRLRRRRRFPELPRPAAVHRAFRSPPRARCPVRALCAPCLAADRRIRRA